MESFWKWYFNGIIEGFYLFLCVFWSLLGLLFIFFGIMGTIIISTKFSLFGIFALFGVPIGITCIIYNVWLEKKGKI